MISLWKGEIPGPKDTRTMRQIAEDVAANHGLTLADLKTRTSARRISHPRHEAMAVMRATGRFSYPQIGKFFGLDHTTAMHGEKAYRARTAKLLKELQAA